jgi:hypothetical protein
MFRNRVSNKIQQNCNKISWQYCLVLQQIVLGEKREICVEWLVTFTIQ